MARPSRFLKVAFDGPAWLYRAGLGWILGTRFLLLTHRGRRSGRLHETVLEVLLFTRSTHESVVASAFGTDADWYRNIQAEPALEVRTGRADYRPEQRFLTPQEAREVAVRFCKRHRLEARLVPKVLPAIGAAISDASGSEPEDMVASLPMVAFRPRN